MSEPRRKVTVDGEMLLNRLAAAERAIADIRQLVIGDLPAPGSPAGININAIIWRDKNSDEVGPEASWAWAFTETREGQVLDEARQLVQEIERYGKVEVGGYVITLGGRDNRLLNRTKVKDRR